MCSCKRHQDGSAPCTCDCPESLHAKTFVEKIDPDHIIRGEE